MGTRFIPTRVGNTRRNLPLLNLSAVHPHACGEHICRHLTTQELAGSSPRVWGTRFINSTVCAWQRFIPTRVGNTWRHMARRRPRPVHPHACGEHGNTICNHAPPCGSSPRVWGTLSGLAHSLQLQRFIPTRVGNTRTALSGRGLKSVHPHACGEHIAHGNSLSACIGSSPRVWGTPDSQAYH